MPGKNEDPCGCGTRPVTVSIHPTTGGQFELQTSAAESVDSLKKAISKKLKVPKERICLLYRDRHLRDGSLTENSVGDGAKITLLPSVESGLLKGLFSAGLFIVSSSIPSKDLGENGPLEDNISRCIMDPRRRRIHGFHFKDGLFLSVGEQAHRRREGEREREEREKRLMRRRQCGEATHFPGSFHLEILLGPRRVSSP
ncbi:unnamed protein product [Darwinula stevensoni]|uniref:Ubiquitin-like domain-containing protein n=1 Tax=Darwinula stevensoni TaxID=69355 RepID=A0A7R9A4X5_9CRUS|nr:unnamed protein product [Darwinula stevensoni]CAG0890855.1 unnamed protein product [Darwinula stevensoni]